MEKTFFPKGELEEIRSELETHEKYEDEYIVNFDESMLFQFEIRSGISFLIIIIIQVLKIFWGRELSEMEARLMKTH